MATNVLTINPKKKVRVRGIALPNEHGSWGFLFEPLVAAIAIAPSVGGLWISLLVIGVFLIRQPLKVFIVNFRLGRNPLETAIAYKFILLYGVICSIGLIGSMNFGKAEFFLPFALIAPLALFQIYCDVNRKSRGLIPELTGAIAISSSSAVIALAGGWSFEMAFALWGIFVARLIPSIIYVRNRLRLEKGKDFSIIPVIILHFIAFGAVGMLSEYGLTSKLTLAVFIVLLGRATLGMSPYRRKMKAMKIGVWEVIYGVLVVLSIIIGHYLQI